MTNLVPFYQRAEPFKTTFKHIQANVGPIGALNKVGLTFTYRMFGALGRVSDQKPMVPQTSIRTRDLKRLYSPCGADERAQRRTVVTVAVEVDANR